MSQQYPANELAAEHVASDGMLISTIVAANVRAREMEDAQAGDAAEAEAHRTRANAAWLALLRAQHGTDLPFLHVQTYYNYAKISLLRRGVALGEVVALAAIDELNAPFADGGSRSERGATRAVPYDLTRDFFVALRARA